MRWEKVHLRESPVLLLALLCIGCMIEGTSSLSVRGGRRQGVMLFPSAPTSLLLPRSSAYWNAPQKQKLWTAVSDEGNDSSPDTRKSADAYVYVDRLNHDVQLLSNGDEILDETTESQIKQSIQTAADELDHIYIDNKDDDNSKRFEPLLGLYNVSHVQTANKGDNPVGGKWTRKNKLAQQIFSTRRTYQHLLPTNSTGLGASRETGDVDVVAEAVNVISLDAFFKLVRLNIILRGDAVPLTVAERNSPKMAGKLSNLAVRAFFDAPRIVLGKGRWLNLQLGPSTSVVLDTTYVDEKVRIGRGGTSGTRFIFFRCSSDEDEEAMEFQSLLQTRKMRTSKVLAVIGAFGVSGVWASLSRGSRVAAGVIGVISTLSALGIGFSTGGVEDDGMDGNVLD
jgi:hypothetical protein